MEHDLITTTQNVWYRLFEQPAHPAQIEDWAADGPTLLTATMKFVGSEYALVIQAHEGVVRHWAASLFEFEPSDCNQTDMMDVMGELSNILAGGFKNRLGPSIDLSLPQIVFGVPPALFECGQMEISTVFSDHVGVFRIIIWRELAALGQRPRADGRGASE